MSSISGGHNAASSRPSDVEELVRELDLMSVEDLTEELEILWSEMDEDSFDGELLEAYLDAIDRKRPAPRPVDSRESYRLFLKRMEGWDRKSAPHAGRRRVLKAGLIAAAVAALLVASVAAAQAAGFKLFDRTAHWTSDIFEFVAPEQVPEDRETPSELQHQTQEDREIPSELQLMRDLLVYADIPTDYLPTYWPEEYEQSEISYSRAFHTVVGGFGKGSDQIVLSYSSLTPGVPGSRYCIDPGSPSLYTHNGIDFYIMTNSGTWLAVWNVGSVEASLGGPFSRDELIKILDSIGG